MVTSLQRQMGLPQKVKQKKVKKALTGAGARAIEGHNHECEEGTGAEVLEDMTEIFLKKSLRPNLLRINLSVNFSVDCE